VLGYFQDVEHLRPDVELVAWPLEDPFSFDPKLVAQTLQAEVGQRPVFLASLSQQFYDASTLEAEYCIVPEDNLYRVYPTAAEAPTACLR
jgi:hypothetical protein